MPRGDPARKATVPDPPPGTGGQARAAEVTATCCGATAGWPGPGAAGAVNCATPAMVPSASSTTPAGTRWTGLTAGHRIPTEPAGPRPWGRESPRTRRPGGSPGRTAPRRRTGRTRALSRGRAIAGATSRAAPRAARAAASARRRRGRPRMACGRPGRRGMRRAAADRCSRPGRTACAGPASACWRGPAACRVRGWPCRDRPSLRRRGAGTADLVPGRASAKTTRTAAASAARLRSRASSLRVITRWPPPAGSTKPCAHPSTG